jgi:hypothetical protein
MQSVAIAISTLALTISALTAWLTLLRRGTVRMTQPTVIYFGPDAPRAHRNQAPPKIYLRALLVATSKRGRVIEAMHASLARNESHQNFNIWVHGDDKLVRGSGLFIGETGVAANHHFLTPKDDSTFQFLPGLYKLNVYARLLGSSRHTLLFSQELELSVDLSQALRTPGTGIYYDWGPDSSRYIPHVEERPPLPDPAKFLQQLGFPEPAEHEE